MKTLDKFVKIKSTLEYQDDIDEIDNGLYTIFKIIENIVEVFLNNLIIFRLILVLVKLWEQRLTF